MRTLLVSKKLLNPVFLPGMGRSLEIINLTGGENLEIRGAFSQQNLQVEFEEERGIFHTVINLWSDPHTMAKLTLFIE